MEINDITTEELIDVVMERLKVTIKDVRRTTRGMLRAMAKLQLTKENLERLKEIAKIKKISETKALNYVLEKYHPVWHNSNRGFSYHMREEKSGFAARVDLT